MNINYLANKYNPLESVCNSIFVKGAGFRIMFNDNFFNKIETDNAIKSLPVKYRNVIILYYVSNYNIAEIAQQLKIHRNTVARRLRKAEEMLRKI